MVQTLLGTDNSTKGKTIETTIHHAKQPHAKQPHAKQPQLPVVIGISLTLLEVK